MVIRSSFVCRWVPSFSLSVGHWSPRQQGGKTGGDPPELQWYIVLGAACGGVRAGVSVVVVVVVEFLVFVVFCEKIMHK